MVVGKYPTLVGPVLCNKAIASNGILLKKQLNHNFLPGYKRAKTNQLRHWCLSGYINGVKADKAGKSFTNYYTTI